MTKKLRKRITSDSLTDETYVIIPPDGGWGWVIVAAGFMCNFVADGVMYSFGLFLHEISISFSTTETNVSLANSLMTGFYYFFGPVICSMINRFGYRVVGFTGGLIAGSCFVISSFANHIAILIVSHGLLGGIGFGMLYMPSIIAVGYYFERWRGVATSISLCGTAAGSILFPQLILIVLKELHWRQKFFCFAGFSVFCSFCTLLFKPLIPVAITVEPTMQPDEEDDVTATRRNKYNNQNFPKTTMGTKSSFMSIRRAYSPNALSMYSFKSYVSTARSVFRGSRYMGSFAGSDRCTTCNKTCFELCCCCCLGKRCAVGPSRPMYRDDILYGASVATLPEYRVNYSQENQAYEYHVSVTRLPTKKDQEEDNKCCMCCPEAVKRTLSTMLDFGLMKSFSFTMVALSGFFTIFGYYVPITYITAKCLRTGMDVKLTGYLISTIGLSNLVGRVISALLSSFPKIKSLPITTVAILIAGLATVGSVFSNHYIAQFTYCSIFGITAAIILSLRPILVVELFGLEKLTNSFGLSMMFYGLACLIGIPFAGVLYDLTHSYDFTFYFAGGSIIFSGIMLIFVPSIIRCEKRRAEKRKLAELNKKATTSRQKPGPKK